MITEKAVNIIENVLITFIGMRRTLIMLIGTYRDTVLNNRDQAIILSVVHETNCIDWKRGSQRKIGKGVGQVCGQSPLLFNIYIEETMKQFLATNELGINTTDGEHYRMVHFANDNVMIAQNGNHLEESLTNMNKFLKK